MTPAEEDALIAQAVIARFNRYDLAEAIRLAIRAGVAHERERAAHICMDGIGAGLRGASETNFDRNAGANWALNQAAAAIRRGE